MTSQTGRHIFPNIFRSKGDQTMKFDQLTEYNMWDILEKPYTKVVEKLVPDLLLKNQNSAYLLINSMTCYTVCFYWMSKLISTQIYQNLSDYVAKWLDKKGKLIWEFMTSQIGK